MYFTKPWRCRATVMLAMGLSTTTAHAFDPWEGAEDRPFYAPAPTRSYSPITTPAPRTVRPLASVAVPAPVIPAAPAPVAIITLPQRPAPVQLASAARSTPTIIAPDSIIAPAPRFMLDSPEEAAIEPAPMAEPITLASAAPAVATAPAPAPVIAAPPVIEPAVPAVAAAAAPTPAPVIAAPPVFAPEAPALAAVTVPEPTPIATETITVPAPLPPEPAATYTASSHRDRTSLGLEIFRDNYKEDSLGLDNYAMYASLTGDHTHYLSTDWFGTVSGRISYGGNNYRSPSGEADSIPQWEFEARALLGYDEDLGNGQHLKPYIGIGGRYFRDEASGELTTLGFAMYDRNILQFYAPVGITYEFPAYELQFAPTIEFGPMLYGRVNSHLGDIPGYYDISNRQNSGYELRAELLVSNLDTQGRGFAFGPFVRYWYFGNSDIDTTPPTPSGTNWIEPENTRVQLGAQVKYLF